MKTKTILAIDGGGIKGVIPACFLAELSRRRNGQRIDQMFDFLVGTSTGGICALALAMGVQADRLLELYSERGREIFVRNPLSFGGLFRPRYSSSGLERLLQDHLGRKRLGEANCAVAVTALRATDKRAIVFSSWDYPELQAWRAARATSAAPTFFAPCDGYWDGGTWAPNPTAAAYRRAAREWPGERIRILSLGCGRKSNSEPVSHLERAGILGLLRHLPGLMMEGGSDFVASEMELGLGKDHLRVDPDLNGASGAMDDVSSANIRDLLKIARGSVEDRMHTVLKFIEGN